MSLLVQGDELLCALLYVRGELQPDVPYVHPYVSLYDPPYAHPCDRPCARPCARPCVKLVLETQPKREHHHEFMA